MKRITPVLLTAFSVLALSFPLTSHADNDGFLIFEATDATQAATLAPAEVVQAAASDVVTQETGVVMEAAANGVITGPVQAQEVAIITPKVEQKIVKKAKTTKRKVQKKSKRNTRKKRTTRAQRSLRSNNLKKAKYYKIRRGDTLYRISVKSGVRLSRLVRLNKLQGSKKHKIQAGQRIRLR